LCWLHHYPDIGEPMKTATFEINGIWFEVCWEITDKIDIHRVSMAGDFMNCNIWGILDSHAKEDILYRISKGKPE
jgi:hypothetical protein